jgi:hypothetical protein
MTETREIELELRGEACFLAALDSHEEAKRLSDATTGEKERVVLSVVSDAHSLLEISLSDTGEVLSADEIAWVNKGISLACEEWLRTPEDRHLVGV